jgi:hypothetical protein
MIMVGLIRDVEKCHAQSLISGNISLDSVLVSQTAETTHIGLVLDNFEEYKQGSYEDGIL